jgi:hypothetical protein
MMSASQILEHGIVLAPPAAQPWTPELNVDAVGGDGGSVEISCPLTDEHVSIRGLDNIKLLHSFLSLVLKESE